MQVGLFELSQDWQKVTDIVGNVFVVGKKYQIQPRGNAKVLFLEADTKPSSDNVSGLFAHDNDVLLYEKGAQDLFARSIGSGSINISILGE